MGVGARLKVLWLYLEDCILKGPWTCEKKGILWYQKALVSTYIKAVQIFSLLLLNNLPLWQSFQLLHAYHWNMVFALNQIFPLLFQNKHKLSFLVKSKLGYKLIMKWMEFEIRILRIYFSLQLRVIIAKVLTAEID